MSCHWRFNRWWLWVLHLCVTWHFVLVEFSEYRNKRCLCLWCRLVTSDAKMKATPFTETSVNFYYTVLLIIFIVVPCVLITLKFLSPTNAPLNYTYKILKYTARLSHYCSYMFRPIWTIIREPMPNLAKVTILSVKIHRYMFSNVVVKSISSCGVYCVQCSLSQTARHTTAWNIFTTTLLNI